MAYSPIKQAHADPATASSYDLTLVRTPSPRLADISFAPLSLSFDDVTGDAAGEDNSVTRADHAESRVSKFLSSLTSSSRQSYDLVEDDDYEVEQVTPTLERHTKPDVTTMAANSSPTFAVEDPPIRTASISRKLPLNHPMPDLQSLQGAYVKNVERLEESAERLSMKSSLDGELRRIKFEQSQKERTFSGLSHAHSAGSGPHRRVSTKSHSNSVKGVNNSSQTGGIVSGAFVSSPTGSLRSPHSMHSTSNKRRSKGSRLSHPLPEPEFEGRPLDLDLPSPKSQGDSLDPRPVRSPSPSILSQDERPTTSGSGDTYQQARSLFTDFDGVHFAPERNMRASRRISLTRPPRARDSRAFKEPQPGEEMIYYPAPVPVMLNLPVRLSRMNWSEQEKKRLQALSSIPDEMRKSAAWLAADEGLPAPNKRISTLPPQLRASAFFDHRSTTADVQLKDGSAVATLDSILDAAAHAPVSAFTDHPFAGNLGNDFYSSEKSPRKSTIGTTEKKTKRKSSISNLLKVKRSSGNLSAAVAENARPPSSILSKHEDNDSNDEDADEIGKTSIAPDADEIPDDESDKDEDSETDSEVEFHPGFSTAPTTLLAELQMRKAQQKSRNRTAVDAFPNGMHSTLLELDTVTQLQQKSRRQKHIKLAWEDKEAVDKENFDDDDVPLGVLFPEKEQQNLVNINRPLGLMEKKELEENEPLSHRRARLRGEPLVAPAPSRSPRLSQQGEDPTKPILRLPDLDGSENGDEEGETLAQRKQRMKDRNEKGTSAEFARQISTELGLKIDDNMAKPESKTPDIEETLGQRRKRLQAEATRNGNRNISGENDGFRPVLRPKRSLADVLRANPVGYVDPNEAKTAKLAMQTHERAKEREAQFLAAQDAERQHAYVSRNKFGNGNENGLIQAPVNHYPGYQQAYTLQPNYGYPPMVNHDIQQSYVHPTMGMAGMPMNYPYQQQMAQGYAYQSAMDMGPPLDPKQRARIEGWRQGIM